MSHGTWSGLGFGDQRGSTLVGGLMLVFLMTLLGAALFDAASIESGQVAYLEEDLRADYAAESGLNRAGADMQYDTIGTKSFCDFKGCDGKTGLLNPDNATRSPV